MLEVVIHKEIEMLEEILPKWNKLTNKFHEITVFQDLSWLKNWWEHKRGNNVISPYIIEIKKADKTIGIIPLYCTIKKVINLNFKVLKPIGSNLSDYLIPVLSKKHLPQTQLQKVFEKMNEDRSNWDFIDWSDIPKGSIFDEYLSNHLSDHDFTVERERTFICPYLRIHKDFEQVKNKYNQSLVKEVLRKERRLEREGTLKYNLVREENEIEPIMNAFFNMHCERWKNTDTPSRYEESKERVYSLETAKSLFRNKLLHLFYLQFNDEIAAVEFALSGEKVIYLYLTAFNMKYRKHSVGNIMLYNLIREACASGYEVVDFTRGDESYKEQWGTEDSFNVKYYLFSKSIRSTLFKMIRQTYYSQQFEQKNIVSRIVTKTIIRGTTEMLSIVDRFNPKRSSAGL